MAERDRAAARSAAAQADSVAPVVTTSSTRIGQRPATIWTASGGHDEGTGEVREALLLAETVLGGRRRHASDRSSHREPERGGHRAGPAPRPGRSRDRAGAAGGPGPTSRGRRAARGLPACGEGIREWSREAPFPAVLQRVERRSDRAAEARAPFELEDPDRQLGRQPERPSRRAHRWRRQSGAAQPSHRTSPSRLQPGHEGGRSRSRSARIDRA